MPRYTVSRPDSEGGYEHEVYDGHLRVEGGALTFRHEVNDIEPFCGIAAGHWAEFWTTKEDV